MAGSGTSMLTSMVAATILTLTGGGCSLKGFAGGVQSGGAGGSASTNSGGAGGTGVGGSGGVCPCGCTAWPETRISDSGPVSWPSLVWADQAWAVAWRDERDGNPEIYFARVDTSGMRIGGELRVTNDPADTLRPTMVWTGSQHAIGYEDWRTGNSAAYLTSVDAAGSGLVLDLEVWKGTGAPRNVVVSWGASSSSYVLTWDDFRDGDFKIHSGVVDAAGTVVATDQRITDATGAATRPAMAAGDFEHGVVWQDTRDGNSEIYFARLDAAGLKIGMETRLSDDPADSLEPAVAFGGQGYGVVWTDRRSGNDDVYLDRLTQGGVEQAPEQAITAEAGSERAPAIAWDGSAYALAWRDERDGDGAIYFARVAADGTTVLAPMRVSPAAAVVDTPSLAWSGSAWAVSWHDTRNGQDAIYFASCAP